ncbi:MAG: hypothetical protein OXG11_02890, partial [Chloroflexi bacterium]|nr:hypothetical protein [Chloroflexota bacterium]
MRSTTVPDDPDHPARRWFQRWSLWPPVLELPPWIRWVRASRARRNQGVIGALVTPAAPLEKWIRLAPDFPKRHIAGVHLIPIGPDGQSVLDRDPHDPLRKRFGTRAYGDLSDAVVVIGKLVRREDVVVCDGLAFGLALACRRSEPVIVTSGAAGWSSLATAVGLGHFAEVILAPGASPSGREAADSLDRRVLAYGGRKRA